MRCEVPRDVECHKTWNGIPQDVKCHEICHVYSDSRWLVAKHRETTKSLHSHNEQVIVALCSYFSIAYSDMVEFVA